MNATYTIQMASKLSGVGVHTIRAWEKRYKALVPDRDSSGHRSYSKPDIEKLMLLSELCLLGYTISKVANFSIEELRDLLQELGKDEQSLVANEFNLVQEKESEVDYGQIRMILGLALRSLNLDVISLELGKLKNKLSARDFIVKIIGPFTAEMELLKKNSPTTPQQLMALEAILKFHLGHYVYSSNGNKENTIAALIVSLDEEGEFAAMSMSHLCHYYGVPFLYLPKGTMSETITLMANTMKVKLVITTGKDNGDRFFSHVEKMGQKLQGECRILAYNPSQSVTETHVHKSIAWVNTSEKADLFLEKIKESL